MFSIFRSKKPKPEIPKEIPKSISQILKINSFYKLKQKEIIWTKRADIFNLMINNVAYKAKEDDIVLIIDNSEDWLDYHIKCLINDTVGWLSVPKNRFNDTNINELLEEI